MRKDDVGQFYFKIFGGELVVANDTVSVNPDGTPIPFSDKGSRRLRRWV